MSTSFPNIAELTAPTLAPLHAAPRAASDAETGKITRRARKEAEALARARIGTSHHRRRLDVADLDVQLQLVLDRLPHRQPLTMPQIIGQLQGRYQQRPSAGDVGLALRRLGWRPKRIWRRDECRGLRCWMPPTGFSW